MKTTILFLSALFLSAAGNGQETSGKSTTSGKIIYEERVRLDIKFGGDAARLAEALPKEQVSNKALCFNSDYSLFQEDGSKNSDEAMSPQTSHMSIQMVVAGGKDKTFCDLKKRKKVEQKEFMTRMFLIIGDIGTAEWKLTGNYRNVLGYNCQEAVSEDKGKKITAWFTPSIPVSTGPAGYGGLPGLILLVDIDNGKRTYTATSIDPSFDTAGLLTMPEDGKKVTSDEFRKIVEEKMKEMGNEAGDGSNQVTIRIKG